jgi:hypothetical protein
VHIDWFIKSRVDLYKIRLIPVLVPAVTDHRYLHLCIQEIPLVSFVKGRESRRSRASNSGWILNAKLANAEEGELIFLSYLTYIRKTENSSCLEWNSNHRS